MTGNREEAAGLLNSLPAARRMEMNRQESRARGKRRKKPYRLGERLRVRK